MSALNALFDGRPLVCRLNSMGVPRSSVNWLPEEDFLERGANRPLELQDFIDRGLVSVLRALHEMMPLLTRHLPAQMAKRRHHASCTQVQRALDAATSQGSASNVLTQQVLPIVSQILARPRAQTVVRTFPEDLLRISPEGVPAKLRRQHFQNSTMGCAAAVRAMLHELITEVHAKIRSGDAGCPRVAYLQPRLKKRIAQAAKGQGKGRGRRTSSKKASGSRLIMLKVRGELSEALPRTNGKLCAVWIASYDVVTMWLAREWRQGVQLPLDLGIVRMIVGVSPDAQLATVEPLVTELPSVVPGEMTPVPCADPLRVVTILLEDVHEACKVHEALRLLLMRLTSSSPSILPAAVASWAMPDPVFTGETVFRRLTSLNPPSRVAGNVTDYPVSLAVGDAGSATRRALIRQVERALGLSLTEAQHAHILEWHLSVLAAPAVPGAGKTTLIEVLTMMCLQHKQDTKVLVVEPTKDMCAAAYSRFERSAMLCGHVDAVARVGLNDATGYDHMSEFMEVRLQKNTATGVTTLKAIDNCLELLHAVAVNERKNNPSAVGNAVPLMLALLARRHAFLDRFHYQTRNEHRAALLNGIRVFILTPAKLAELRGGPSELSAILDDETTQWGLFIDEYQKIFWKLGVALSLGCSFVCLTGDVHQERAPRGTPHDRRDLAPTTRSSDDPVKLPWSMLPNWLGDSETLQRTTLAESFRLGPLSVQALQDMFPGRHDEMVSAQQPGNDLIALTLLPRLNDWSHDGGSEEVVWSPMFGLRVVVLIAVEVIFLVCNEERAHVPESRPGGVLVVSFWNRFLSRLQQHLEDCLPRYCAMIHDKLGIPVPALAESCYDFNTLRKNGLLRLSAPVAAGGADAPITILCLPHRQKKTGGGSELRRKGICFSLPCRATLDASISLPRISEQKSLPWRVLAMWRKKCAASACGLLGSIGGFLGGPIMR